MKEEREKAKEMGWGEESSGKREVSQGWKLSNMLQEKQKGWGRVRARSNTETKKKEINLKKESKISISFHLKVWLCVINHH